MSAQSIAPTLAAATRTVTGKQVKQLRTQGLLPAVVYGHNQASLSLTVPEKEFGKLFREVGSTTLIDLAVDGGKATKVLVHAVHKDPRRGHAIHVDFYLVNLKEKLHTAIPLVFEGVADAVDVLGGNLITVKDEVQVECLPQDLVQEITVDISVLKTFDDVIRISDITVPAGITITDDLEETVLSISAPRSEEEIAALDEAPVGTAAAEVASETKSGPDTAPVAEGEKNAKK
jgi:large subunit ribosomal protein L25